MYYTLYVRQYYIRVDSGEDVRKVNGNREEVYAQTTGGLCTWCKLSFPDAAISPATSSMSALC